MPTISDEAMRHMLSTLKSYTFVVLKPTAKRKEPGSDRLVWEHGRRNLSLRAKGVLPIICQISGDSEIGGVEIFNADIEVTKALLDGDPAIQAGVLTYEAYPCRSFPGDSLP